MFLKVEFLLWSPVEINRFVLFASGFVFQIKNIFYLLLGKSFSHFVDEEFVGMIYQIHLNLTCLIELSNTSDFVTENQTFYTFLWLL